MAIENRSRAEWSIPGEQPHAVLIFHVNIVLAASTHELSVKNHALFAIVQPSGGQGNALVEHSKRRFVVR